MDMFRSRLVHQILVLVTNTLASLTNTQSSTLWGMHVPVENHPVRPNQSACHTGSFEVCQILVYVQCWKVTKHFAICLTIEVTDIEAVVILTPVSRPYDIGITVLRRICANRVLCVDNTKSSSRHWPSCGVVERLCSIHRSCRKTKQ